MKPIFHTTPPFPPDNYCTIPEVANYLGLTNLLTEIVEIVCLYKARLILESKTFFHFDKDLETTIVRDPNTAN